MAVVAARQRRSPAFRRRTPVRRHRARLAAVSGPVLALVFGFVVAGALGDRDNDPGLGAGLYLQSETPPAGPAAHRQ